jgi:hypothetical protein
LLEIKCVFPLFSCEEEGKERRKNDHRAKARRHLARQEEDQSSRSDIIRQAQTRLKPKQFDLCVVAR